MQPILQVSDLNIQLGGETITEGLSFEIEAGDCLAIIGPNGAGKTVLLRALLGLIPYTGAITWDDNAAANGAVRLGYVPQKIDADKHLPVTFKNLFTAKASILGITEDKIKEVIKTVELSEKILHTPVGHLSGGQFQRALIAFALLGDPQVLLFDEPTASIDVTGEQQIYDLIHRLQDERGITVILVSHDLSFVNRYATKVLCLSGSREPGHLCFGAPEDALTPEVLDQLYGPHKYVHHLYHRDDPSDNHPHNHS